jgi:hypothetical protein
VGLARSSALGNDPLGPRLRPGRQLLRFSRLARGEGRLREARLLVIAGDGRKRQADALDLNHLTLLSPGGIKDLKGSILHYAQMINFHLVSELAIVQGLCDHLH